jgi:hypothetical protein
MSIQPPEGFNAAYFQKEVLNLEFAFEKQSTLWFPFEVSKECLSQLESIKKQFSKIPKSDLEQPQVRSTLKKLNKILHNEKYEALFDKKSKFSWLQTLFHSDLKSSWDRAKQLEKEILQNLSFFLVCDQLHSQEWDECFRSIQNQEKKDVDDLIDGLSLSLLYDFLLNVLIPHIEEKEDFFRLENWIKKLPEKQQREVWEALYKRAQDLPNSFSYNQELLHLICTQLPSKQVELFLTKQLINPDRELFLDLWEKIPDKEAIEKLLGDRWNSAISLMQSVKEDSSIEEILSFLAKETLFLEQIAILQDLSSEKKEKLLSTMGKDLAALFDLGEAVYHYTPSCKVEEKPRYGTKYDNILFLHENLQEIKGVQVVLPFGLAETEVMEFLLVHAPRIFSLWKEIIQQAFQERSSLIDFIKKDSFGEKRIQQIQHEVKKVFSNPLLYQDFPKFASLQNFLEQIAKIKSFLMVRSTGCEDTDITNAGGNSSVNYVTPDLEMVFQAVGEVIASYFSIDSLKNRIDAGDNPFTPHLQLAVFLQELVGEPVNGEKNPLSIPISLVLFTNEPYYVGKNEKAGFRVMRISASFGHGEAVVSAQGIACDTLLILQSNTSSSELYILYDNQTKEQRLVPVKNEQKIELSPVDNPEELQYKRCLDAELLERLFALGTFVENLYQNKPTDMEIVVKNGTIYPVQARQINRQLAIASYVDPEALDKEAVDHSLQVDKVLVAAHSSVIKIEKSEKILSAFSLKLAEKSFDKDLHELVIVAQDEPPLSHPIVNFSSQKIPCFFSKNLKSIEQLSQKGPLIVCVQQGKIYPYLVKGGVNPEKKGYTAHPASIQISLDSAKNISPLRFSKPSSQSALLDLQGMSMHIQAISLNKAGLETLKLPKIEDRHASLKARASKLTHIPDELEYTLDAIHSLAKTIDRAAQEFKKVKEKEHTDLEALFHAKILQRLILQQEEGILNESLLTLPTLEAYAKTTLDYQQMLPKKAEFAREILLAEEAFLEPIKEKWISFLHAIELLAIPKQDKTDFKRFLQLLGQLGVSSTWLNLFFSSMQGSEQENLQKVLQESRISLEHLLALKKEVSSLERTLNLFSDLSTIAAAKERLCQVSKHFQKDIILQFHEKSDLEKLILMRLMLDFVTVFDASFKTLKMAGSPKEIGEIFSNLLQEYLSVFDTWGQKLIPQEDWLGFYNKGSLYRRSSSPTKDQVNFRGYVNLILQRIESSDPLRSSSLHPSHYFSAASAVLGAATAIECHEPRTLEDCFTLIHQNLIGVVYRLQKKTLTQERLIALGLPREFLYAMEQVSNLRDQEIEESSCKLTSCFLEKKTLTAHYNISMRFHSASIKLHYEGKTGKYSCELAFYGGTQYLRWENSLIFFKLQQRFFSFFAVRESSFYDPNNLYVHLDLLPKKERIKDSIDFTIDAFNTITHYANYDRIYARILNPFIQTFEKQKTPLLSSDSDGLLENPYFYDCFLSIAREEIAIVDIVLEFWFSAIQTLQDKKNTIPEEKKEKITLHILSFLQKLVNIDEKNLPKRAYAYREQIQNCKQLGLCESRAILKKLEEIEKKVPSFVQKDFTMWKERVELSLKKTEGN